MLRIPVALAGLVGIAALAALSPAQTSSEILYYRFLRPNQKQIINSAGGGPKLGTVVTTLPQNMITTVGKSGFALRGTSNATTAHNYVDSGWSGTLTNDFTVAWYQRQEVSPGTTLSYVISNRGSFRIFTNGVAATGLWCRAWGGAPSDLKLTTNIQSISAARWVHIALVVDWSGSRTAKWYVDGKLDTTIAITAPANAGTGQNTFRLGAHTSTSLTYAYNIDEFRLMDRAASACEVSGWINANLACDGPYNEAGCTAKLASANGPPKLGTQSYRLTMQGKAQVRPFVVALGLRGVLKLDLGLVYPKMRGCKWDNSAIVFAAGATNQQGRGTLPYPIPNAASLVGLDLFNQGAIIPDEGANGFLVRIGN